MKQMAKMQRKMEELQKSLGEEVIEISSGGGAVVIEISLQSEVKGIRLDPELLKEEPAVVEDVLLEAVQTAVKTASEKNEAAVQALTAEMQVPGMPGLG